MKIYNACIVAMAVSLSLLAVFAVLGIVVHRWRLGKLKEGKRISHALIPFYLMVGGFFLASVIVYYPLYYYGMLAEQSGFVRFLNSALLAIQNVLRLFTLNGEYDGVMEFIAANFAEAESAGVAYSVYLSVIMIVAPALTAGFLISFFRELSSHLKYLFYPNADLYVLSELNEMSIALAEDIATSRKKGERRRLIVFTDVYPHEEEESYELISRAKGIGAICLRKDITELWMKPLRAGIYRKFYFIGEDFDENLRQGLALIQRYKGSRYDNNKTELYIFSDNSESESLLNAPFMKGKEEIASIQPAPKKRRHAKAKSAPDASAPQSDRYTLAELLEVPTTDMKVRRVSENRNLVLSTLRGTWLFDRAERTGKHIKVALVGLGGYGTELLKALCWYTQMPGYTVELHVFDVSPETEDRVRALAPELVSRIGVKEEGECFYTIEFHCPVDVMGRSFCEELKAIDGDLTAVFVTLGDDERNIEASMRIRSQLGRDIENAEDVPPVYAVVYSPTKTAVTGKDSLCDFKGRPYGVHLIGDLKTRYSLRSIERRDIEELAKRSHLQYIVNTVTRGEESEKEVRKSLYDFEHFEYYRRSSTAQAVYLETYRLLAQKRNSDETPTQENEHKRWNAFMRAEGYVRCGKGKTDHIAKCHEDLVPFGKLEKHEKDKDEQGEVYAANKKQVEDTATNGEK